MATLEQRRHAGLRLVYDESPIALTRSQWATDARGGRAHRFAGQRFVVRHDRRRGVRVISPVRLVD